MADGIFAAARGAQRKRMETAARERIQQVRLGLAESFALRDGGWNLFPDASGSALFGRLKDRCPFHAWRMPFYQAGADGGFGSTVLGARHNRQIVTAGSRGDVAVSQLEPLGQLLSGHDRLSLPAR